MQGKLIFNIVFNYISNYSIIFFNQSIDRNFNYFKFGAILNDVDINILVHVSWCQVPNYLWYIPNSGTTGS